MNFQLIITLAIPLIVPVLFLLLIDKKKKTGEARILPPGPRKLPLIGNLHLLGSSPHRSLMRLSKEYGPITFLQLGSIRALVISSDDEAREVINTHDHAFSGRPALHVTKKISYNFLDVGFSANGDSWRELRKIVNLELFSIKRVKVFESVRGEEVKLMLDTIASSLGRVNLSELAL